MLLLGIEELRGSIRITPYIVDSPRCYATGQQLLVSVVRVHLGRVWPWQGLQALRASRVWDLGFGSWEFIPCLGVWVGGLGAGRVLEGGTAEPRALRKNPLGMAD